MENSFGLQASCVEYIIMMSDNLASLFPNTYIRLAGIHLESQQVFAITSTLIVLPTVWLKNLGLLSYLSGFLSILLLSFIYFSSCIFCLAAGLKFCVFRRRSSCINPGGTLFIMGWSGGPSWISSKWNSFRPHKPFCYNWNLWIQLCWPFGFSKYLFFHERTVTISISFNSQVTKNCPFFKSKLFTMLSQLTFLMVQFRNLMRREMTYSLTEILHYFQEFPRSFASFIK